MHNIEPRRKEFITNSLILFAICLTSLNYISPVISFPLATIILIILLILYFLSKLGFHKLAFLNLILLCSIPSVYTLITSSGNFYLGILSIALLALITGVIISPKTGTIYFCSLFLLGLSQSTPARQNAQLESLVNFIPFIFLLGIILIITWLTNRKLRETLRLAQRSERALQQEKELLEQKVKERTRFIYKLADYGKATASLVHDLATPLTNLTINLEYLQETAEPESLVKAVRSARIMESYIEEVRAQLKNQKTNVLFSPTEELKEAASLFENVKIVSKTSEQLFGSPAKFAQAVSNLMANAVQACKQDESNVMVRLEKLKNNLVLTVQDFGAGIPLEQLDKIWQPFYSSKAGTNMGIGLSITKEIIETEFHGHISVKSKLNYGTTFTVTLPNKLKLNSDHIHQP